MWQKEGISWQKGGNLRGKPDRRKCIMTERRFHKETGLREGILWQTGGDFWRKTDKKKTLSDRREVIFWGKPGRKKALSDRRKAISEAHGWWTALAVIIILIARPPPPYVQGADFKDHKALRRLKKGPWQRSVLQTKRGPLWHLSFLASTLQPESPRKERAPPPF